MQFKVVKQYSRGSETFLKDFKKKDEAVLFIQNQLLEDQRFNVRGTIYRIYDFDDFLEEFTLNDVKISPTQASSTGQTGQAQSFNPTPFNTTPNPGGMPHSWVKEKEGEKKDK